MPEVESPPTQRRVDAEQQDLEGAVRCPTGQLFPEASRFIRAESTLTNPLKNDALQRLVRDELSTEPEIHALVKTRTTSVSTLRSLLAQYGYALADAPCQPARTRIDRDLCLYKAVRR